nr:hypothetical protein [Tanacetum cinerariifolium]
MKPPPSVLATTVEKLVSLYITPRGPCQQRKPPLLLQKNEDCHVGKSLAPRVGRRRPLNNQGFGLPNLLGFDLSDPRSFALLAFPYVILTLNHEA